MPYLGPIVLLLSTSSVAQIAPDSTDASTVLRRLSHREYRHTLADLLHVNLDSYDPTADFPADAEVNGFDIAEALVLSDFLLDAYVHTAASALEKAVAFGSRPAPAHITIDPWEFEAYQEFDFVWGWLYYNRYHAEIGHSGWRGRRLAPWQSVKGMPRDGRYRIKVEAAAIGRDNPYGQEYFLNDLSEPMRLAVRVSDCSENTHAWGNASERHVTTFEIEDDERRSYEIETWMDAGFTAMFGYENGPPYGRFRSKMRAILRDFHPDVAVRNFGGRLELPRKSGSPRIEDVYRGPRIRVYKVEIIEVPQDPWPGHLALFGPNSETPESVDIAATFQRFASRAFRRPVTRDEAANYAELTRARVAKGDDLVTAIKAGFVAILSAPWFLYHIEPAGDLDDRALASRLSYFLWSSLPDATLMTIASSGELREHLRREAERMLALPKSRRLVDGFTDQWLGLSKLGTMPPDERRFATYYSDELEPAMRAETRLFFERAVRNNRPVSELLTADYTFVNRVLAKHYRIPEPDSNGFERVPLEDPVRRGLLGHASVLTVTSNGVETSPVTRGVWVLDRILGTPSSPPPPNVPALQPDVRGASTLREQLSMHRSAKSCKACHAKIDPLGFALEVFDPIGRARDRYPNSLAIDTAGTLPGGEEFDDVGGLRQLLAQQTRKLTRSLTEKLLTYACGRTMTRRDQAAIDRIVDKALANDLGLRELILEVVACDVFGRN